MPARRAALRLLDAVLRQGLPLETALGRAGAGLPAADRALAHALAATVLRRLPDLDALIDARTRLRLADDAKVRTVLRLALAGALALGTPPHAAIATALPLLAGGPRRLAHGVLGAVLRDGATLPETPTLPEPVRQRWTAAWGMGVADAASSALANLPPVELTLKDEADAAALLAAVAGATQVVPWQVRVPAGTDLTALPGYAEGRWWAQDLAAALATRIAGRGPGTALDLCAAPGGKTMALAAAGWQVTAVDQSEPRLDRLRENLARTALPADIVRADIERWAPPAPADLVFLDAPCSATGVFRRHPDVLYRTSPPAIAALAEGQARLLARAADWVKPGGRLVYAVCSLEPQEGEAVAAAFASAQASLLPDPIAADELPPIVRPTGDGHLRILPGGVDAVGGTDGFFVARFRRPA